MITLTLTAIVGLILTMPTAHASNIEDLFQDLSIATLENIRDNGGINRSYICDEILSTVYRDRHHVITVSDRVVNGDWKIQTSPLNTYKLALLQEIFGCPSTQIQWVKDSACQRSIYGNIFMYGNPKAPLLDRIDSSEYYDKHFLIYNTSDKISPSSITNRYCQEASPSVVNKIREVIDKQHCKILMKDIYQQPYGYNDHWQNYDINHLGGDYIAVDWSIIADQASIDATRNSLEHYKDFCNVDGYESYETYLRWIDWVDERIE
ncbi:MAG TPA: hypothetical protein QF353_05010 [Gammaproteobacteria bacterium]|nr:hypothetical protein [Gammaproteobacteria bacterium]